MSRFRAQKISSSMPSLALGVFALFILCLQGCLGNGQGYPGGGVNNGAKDSSALLPEGFELMMSCRVTGTDELVRLYQEEASADLSAIWVSTATQRFDDIVGEKLADAFVFSSAELSLTLELPAEDASIVSGFYETVLGSLQIGALDVDGAVSCSVSKVFLESIE